MNVKARRAIVLAALLAAPARAQVRSGASVEAARAPVGVVPLGGLSPAPVPVLSLALTPMLSQSVGAPTSVPGALRVAAPLPAAAIGGPAAVVPATWVGDHEAALIGGTPEQIDSVMRGVADGSIGLRHPGSEQERLAAGIIRGVTADWTPRLLGAQADAAAGGPFEVRRVLRGALMTKSSQLARARSATQGPIERAVFVARRFAVDHDVAWTRTFDAGRWLERLSRRTLGRRADIVRGVAERVPGMNADRIIYRSERLGLFGVPFRGYAMGGLFENGAPSPGYAWIGASKEADFFHTVTHEGWHLGDRAYMRGRAALKLLYGDAAPGLYNLLEEGYTELRARRTLAALREDALAGKGGALGERYLRALKARYGSKDDDGWKGYQRTLAAHPYHPLVEAVARLEAQPGGRDALEAYAKEGDVAPLMALVGERRLTDLTISLMTTPASKGPFAREAYVAAGFPWLFKNMIMPRLADGTLDLEIFERMKATAVAASERAALRAYGRSPAARAAAFRRLATPELAEAVFRGDSRAAEPLVDAAVEARRFDFLILPSGNTVRRIFQYAVVPGFVALAAWWLGAPGWGVALALAAAFVAADARNAARAAFTPGERLEELGIGAEEPGFASALVFPRFGRAPAPRPERPADWTEPQARAFLAAVVEPFRARLEAAGYEPMPMLTWDDEEQDCRVRFDGLFHNVILSRGFLRTPGLTADALTLAVVHEIGHMLGSGPKDKHMRLAVEGEADYFAGAEGGAVLAALGSEANGLRRSAEYREAEGWLKSRGIRGADLRTKARALAATLRLRRVFHADSAPLDLDRPDESVAAATMTDYPSDQARLDTMAAGLAGSPRPRSWALPADF